MKATVREDAIEYVYGTIEDQAQIDARMINIISGWLSKYITTNNDSHANVTINKFGEADKAHNTHLHAIWIDILYLILIVGIIYSVYRFSRKRSAEKKRIVSLTEELTELKTIPSGYPLVAKSDTRKNQIKKAQRAIHNNGVSASGYYKVV